MLPRMVGWRLISIMKAWRVADANKLAMAFRRTSGRALVLKARRNSEGLYSYTLVNGNIESWKAQTASYFDSEARALMLPALEIHIHPALCENVLMSYSRLLISPAMRLASASMNSRSMKCAAMAYGARHEI